MINISPELGIKEIVPQPTDALRRRNRSSRYSDIEFKKCLYADAAVNPFCYRMQDFISIFSRQVAVEKYRDLGLLTATSDSIPRLKSEFDATDVVDGRNRVLKYPGKLCTDNTGERIFISDSGHHRIVVVKSDCGEVETIVGDGIRGFRDGTLATSRFSSPQVID